MGLNNYLPKLWWAIRENRKNYKNNAQNKQSKMKLSQRRS